MTAEISAMLRAESVEFAYGDRTLLENVSFRLGAGEALAVLGPNGSGKTTLLKILAGLLAPCAGAVEIDGRPIARMGPAERALRVAYVPQGIDATVPFTVFDTVLMGRYPHLRGRWERDVDREVALRAVAAMRLEGVVDRPIANLSGGERQRTLIAAALAQEAPILLLDEPTTALDLRARAETLDLLARLRVEEGRTMVVVTHDIDLAARSCGRVLLLGAPDGPVVGDANDILVPDRLAAAYGVGVRVIEIPGEPVRIFLPVSTPPPNGVRTHSQQPTANSRPRAGGSP